MENNFVRVSSCRGVAFEIRHPQYRDDSPFKPCRSNSLSLQWPRSLRVVPAPSSDILDRSVSRGSSHFCDVEDDDDDDAEADIIDVEDGRDQRQKVEQLIAPRSSSVPLPPAAGTERLQQARSPQKLEAATKPPTSRIWVMLFDQGIFTVYKRLFMVFFALNLMGVGLAATGRFPADAKDRAALFSIANIFVSVLCRSEAFLRAVFWVAVTVLGRPFVPLRVKTVTTSLLQSLGGIHSGCGVSSIAWLIYALIRTLRERENASPEIIIVSSSILALLLLSALAAFPLVRHLHHNVFERTHRFAGWASLSLLWLFIVLKVSFDPETRSYRNGLGPRLIKSLEFWFTAAITVLILIPWLTVRRVPVRVSSPSGHASIIKFNGGVKAGLLGRISPSPLSEWHAFGIISDNKEEHMILAGAVGDFTQSLVADPPAFLWVRQMHFAGLPYLANMYGRVVLVATGSGICVFLSFLLQPCKADVCVLWITKNVEGNFGKEIKEWTSGSKEKVIVHDTAVLGRPNVAELTVDTAKEWGAEAVFVTSNPAGSRDIVDACKANGIAAFGPIWDS